MLAHKHVHALNSLLQPVALTWDLVGKDATKRLQVRSDPKMPPREVRGWPKIVKDCKTAPVEGDGHCPVHKTRMHKTRKGDYKLESNQHTRDGVQDNTYEMVWTSHPAVSTCHQSSGSPMALAFGGGSTHPT